MVGYTITPVTPSSKHLQGFSNEYGPQYLGSAIYIYMYIYGYPLFGAGGCL